MEQFFCIYAPAGNELELVHLTSLKEEHAAALGILQQERGKCMHCVQSLAAITDQLVSVRLHELYKVMQRVESLLTTSPSGKKDRGVTVEVGSPERVRELERVRTPFGGFWPPGDVVSGEGMHQTFTKGAADLSAPGAIYDPNNFMPKKGE